MKLLTTEWRYQDGTIGEIQRVTLVQALQNTGIENCQVAGCNLNTPVRLIEAEDTGIMMSIHTTRMI